MRERMPISGCLCVRVRVRAEWDTSGATSRAGCEGLMVRGAGLRLGVVGSRTRTGQQLAVAVLYSQLHMLRDLLI